MRADATEFPVELAVCVVERADSQVFMAAYLRDLTKQKEAEAALAERARLADLTADVAMALAQGVNATRILQDSAEAIVRHLDAAFVRIWTRNAENVLELGRAPGSIRISTAAIHVCESESSRSV